MSTLLMWLLTGLAWVLYLFPILYYVYFKVFQKPSVEFSFEPSYKYDDEIEDTLIAHFPGFNGDGREQIRNVEHVILEVGDLLPVHYDGVHGKQAQRFDQKLVVRESVDQIAKGVEANGYTNVVLLGTSFGAKVALKVAKGLRRRGIITKAVLVDPPMWWLDLQLAQKIMAPFLWLSLFIPVANWIHVLPLARRVIMKIVAQDPKDNETDADLTWEQRQALDDSVVEARKTRLLFCRDQTPAILAPLFGFFWNVWGKNDVVIIRSDGDNNVVKSRAHKSWKLVLGIRDLNLMRIVLPNAKHAGYGQNPGELGWGLDKAFALLELKK